MSLFDRSNRRSEKGIWQALLAGLVKCDDPPDSAMRDSTAVCAHRSAAGTKRAASTSDEIFAGGPTTESTRSPTATAASTP